MKLAIVAASGPTGQEVLQQALDGGHQVVALVRDPSKITIKLPQLTVEKVNIFDCESLVPVLKGCDAVVSCLGFPGGLPFTTVTGYSDSAKVITTAMNIAGVSRFVAITSWCTVYDSSHPFFIEWLMKPLWIGRQLDDMARMEDYVSKQCTDINYTFVRPPGLGKDALEEKETLAVEGQFVPNGHYMMPRANVAKFMLDTLNNAQWDRKKVAIALPK